MQYKFLFILALTGICALISIFGKLEYLIGAYIVLIASWIIFIVNCIVKFWQYKKKKLQLKEIVTERFNSIEECILEFNEGLIKVTTEKFTSEVKWNYFKAYLEEDDTIYILTEQVSAAWSFSKQEIGEDFLVKIKQIVKEKLPPLKIKNYNA